MQDRLPQHRDRDPPYDLEEALLEETPVVEKPIPWRLVRPLSFASSKPALLILALCLAVCGLYWRHPIADQLWVSYDAVFGAHEHWRLLSAVFAHADYGHLLSNAGLLFLFGWFLHTSFGMWTFPMASILAGVLTNLLTIMSYEGPMRLVGASGMVYAMAGQWLVLYMGYETRYRWQIKLLRALGVAFILLFPTQFRPQTSYLAHAYGFIVGIGLGSLALIIFRNKDRRTNSYEDKTLQH